MGEARTPFFEPSFNRAIKVRSRDERLSSNGGALLLREADHRLGLVESLASGLEDPRHQRLIRYGQVELLRERLYAFALGYSAWDDADLLAHDPAVRLSVNDERIDGAARIVDCGITHDLGRAQLRIDLDFAHVAAVGEACVLYRLVAKGGERPAPPRPLSEAR